MIKTICQHCNNEFPLNDTYKIKDTICCVNCLENVINDKTTNENRPGFEQQLDPTICFNCGFDNDTEELPRISNIPACQKCIEFFNNRPFPNWIKASFLTVIAIVIFAFAHNFRFINSFYKTKAAARAFENGDVEKAYKLQNHASKLVPEDKFLRLSCYFYKGVYDLSQQDYKEAIDNLNKCKTLHKEVIGYYIIVAEIGLSFDNKDYDLFLKYAIEFNSKYNNSFSNAQVASAYACKYTVSGDEQYKNDSFVHLEKAKKMSNDNEEFREYEQRILYRLYTKEIITREEFYKKHPNGWKKPEED